MERVVLNQAGADRALDAAVEVLLAGGVIAAPTETVYGLMTLWDCAAGRDRIFRMKARPSDRRLQMLAGSVAVAQQAGLIADARLARLAACFWPGPLTVVCRALDGDTIGLRLPDHPFLEGLLKRLTSALAATSANRSGAPAAVSGDEAVAGLMAEPDLLVDGGTVGEDHGGMASTVVDLTDAEIRVLRAGPISAAQIMAALGQT